MNRWRSRLAELQGDSAEALPVQNVRNVQNMPPGPTFEHFEQYGQRAEPVPEPTKVLSDSEEERAGIVEYDGGAPRDWAEVFARLDCAKPPADVPVPRWRLFIDDCRRFLDEWADRAMALGWHALDLFGCDRERPFARLDHAGLLWLIEGRNLIVLTTNTATIETASGVRQTYYRRPAEPGAVLAWQVEPAAD
jgi:hypothetical protein